MPLLNAAPPWTGNRSSPWRGRRSRYSVLYHGCTSDDKNAIQARGVDPSKGRPNTDFGRGFYTTTIRRQARHWAWNRYYAVRAANPKKTALQPVVLWFRVDRHELAKLEWVSFGSGDYDNEDFWSLVQHCRQSTPLTDPPPHTVYDHEGPVAENGDWYDVASGPVAAFWDQRSAMHDADQVSFHTSRAGQLLTDLIRSGDKRQYDWQVVT
jgi:hypothetical protein